MNGNDIEGQTPFLQRAGRKRPGPILLIAGALVFSSVPALAGKGFWAPHPESVTPATFFPLDGTVDETNSWTQQLRNLKDVLRVDAFRPKPTPIPVPTPVPTLPLDGTSWFVISAPTLSWTLSPWDYDANPPHPLTDYLRDVSGLYGNDFFPGIAKELKKGGIIVENLIAGRGRHRFREARAFASRLEVVARKSTNDALVASYSSRYTDALCDDYRSIARAFAHDLRLAARNAAAGHRLIRGLTYRPERMLLRVKSTHYAFSPPRVELIQTDGFGGSTSALVSEPDFSSGGGGGSIIVSGGVFSSSLNRTGTLTTVSIPAPTPTP